MNKQGKYLGLDYQYLISKVSRVLFFIISLIYFIFVVDINQLLLGVQAVYEAY